jgi:hypothetical protein
MSFLPLKSLLRKVLGAASLALSRALPGVKRASPEPVRRQRPRTRITVRLRDLNRAWKSRPRIPGRMPGTGRIPGSTTRLRLA